MDDIEQFRINLTKIQPWDDFFDFGRFSLPQDLPNAMARIHRNLKRYAMNYLCFILVFNLFVAFFDVSTGILSLLLCLFRSIVILSYINDSNIDEIFFFLSLGFTFIAGTVAAGGMNCFSSIVITDIYILAHSFLLEQTIKQKVPFHIRKVTELISLQNATKCFRSEIHQHCE